MKTLLLLNAFLSGQGILSRASFRKMKEKDQLWILPLAAVGILGAVGFYGWVLVNNYRGLLYIGLAIGEPGLALYFAMLISWVLVFIVCIPVSLSILYYANDKLSLLALPLRPLQIMAGKYLFLFLNTLPIHLALYLPAVFVTATETGWSSELVLATVLQALLGNLVPLALGLLFSVLLMKLVNLSRFRILLEAFGMIMLLVLVVLVQIFFSRSMINGMGGTPAPSAFADLYRSIFAAMPPLRWAAQGAAPGGAFLELVFAAICLGFPFLVLFLVRNTFLSGLIESRQGARKSGHGVDFASRPARGALRTLIGRELAIIGSNSTFLFEALIEALVFPMLLVIYALILPEGMLASVKTFLLGVDYYPLILFAVLALMASFNTVSSTAFSREGKSFALSLILPQSGRRQVGAKLVLSFLMFFTAYLANLAIAFVLVPFAPIHFAWLVPAGAAILLFSSGISLSLDMKNPRLRWTHPQEAMKQNMNVVAAMGLNFLVIIGLGGCGAAAWYLHIPALASGIAISSLVAIFAGVMVPGLLKRADKLYAGGFEMII